MLNREDFLSFKTETKMTGNARINVTDRSNFITTVASTGSRVIPRGWADGHDEANGHFLQFSECT